MKKLYLVVIAVSLKDKALSLAARPSKQTRNSICRSERCEHEVQTSISSLSTSRRCQRASSRLIDSAVALRNGANVDDAGGSTNNDQSPPRKEDLLASSTSTPPSSPSTLAATYYLIWSPGFVQKFAWMSASLWGMHLLQWDARLSGIITHQWKAVTATFPPVLSNRIATAAAPNVILPLLSSSCCLIQLVINVLVGAGGCAGFNTLLGPVRPLFLAILVSLNIFTGASPRQSLWRYSLALMPEGVFFCNEYRKRQWQHRVENAATATAPTSMDEGRLRATMMVNIPTMGCVACINKIESRLRSCAPNNIATASSWLEKDRKGGSAKLDVYVDSEQDLQALSATVVNAIEGAGFQDSVVTALEIDSSKSYK